MNRVRIDPAYTAVLPLAFGRVPLDQPPRIRQTRPEEVVYTFLFREGIMVIVPHPRLMLDGWVQNTGMAARVEEIARKYERYSGVTNDLLVSSSQSEGEMSAGTSLTSNVPWCIRPAAVGETRQSSCAPFWWLVTLVTGSLFSSEHTALTIGSASQISKLWVEPGARRNTDIGEPQWNILFRISKK